MQVIKQHDAPAETIDALRHNAQRILDAEVDIGVQIGKHGLALIQELSRQKHGEPVQILTHCNAGWLACVDWGTATAPMYCAFNAGVPIHVYVDETRPRNQGAALTAWELGKHGIHYTLIADNVGGHLMQNGMVDMVIVGTDRVALNGDVANKIGTYLKALAAHHNNVPFYVAAPSSSIDWQLPSGKQIPIEQRDQDEVKWMSGRTTCGTIEKILICPEDATAANYGFDVTPAELITGIITERGCSPASQSGLLALFPEKREVAVR